MGRLTGEDLEYIYGHLKPTYHKLARKDRIWFEFANQQEGRKGHDIIKRVYKDYYRSLGDIGNYTDFNIQFTNEQAADWVLADIDDSINSYAYYHPDTGLGGDAGQGVSTTSSDYIDPYSEKTTDWSTYIIIGVAAAIIIALLLWNGKKK